VTQPRIVTLTVNPTIDIACDADEVRPTHKVHTKNEMQDPGGGGVNVARVVHELGGEVLAIVLAGGLTGDLLQQLLDQNGVPCQAIPIAGHTRISYTVHDLRHLKELTHQREYRFVAPGPLVAETEWQAALTAVAQVVQQQPPDGWIVASGSLAPGMPADFYARVAHIAADAGRHFALDTSGPALPAALGPGVALIKPSLGEFTALAGGDKLHGHAALEQAAMALVHAGKSERIAVTRGHLGAMLATRAGVLHRPPVKVEVRSAVGAGDSFTGAMVLSLARGDSDEQALAWGMAAGAAAVMHPGTAHPTRADVERLHAEMN